MADGKVEIETGIDEKGISKGLNKIAEKLKKFGNSPSLVDDPPKMAGRYTEFRRKC